MEHLIPVSMSLCEVPTPSQELVDKYNDMKATFYKRLMNAFSKLQAASAPVMQNVGENEHGQALRNYVEDLQSKPEFQAVVKVATWVTTDLFHYLIWRIVSSANAFLL